MTWLGTGGKVADRTQFFGLHGTYWKDTPGLPHVWAEPRVLTVLLVAEARIMENGIYAQKTRFVNKCRPLPCNKTEFNRHKQLLPYTTQN